MSIKIVCEECGAKKKVNERFGGRRIRCPECEAVIRVPDAPVAQPEAAVPAKPESAIPTASEVVPTADPVSEGLESSEDGTSDAWDQAIQTGTSVVTPIVDADSALDALQAQPADSVAPVAITASTVAASQAETSPPSSSQPLPTVGTVSQASAGQGEDDQQDSSDDDDDDEVLVRTKRPEEEMDMTPMVDVTFLLLIFFMVTAAFSLQKSIEMPRQQTEAPSLSNTDPDEETETVDVEVDENGSFLVLTNEWERETPGKQNLVAALRDANAGKNEPMKLNVKVHEQAKVRAMVDAMDAGTIADYSPILITQVDGFD